MSAAAFALAGASCSSDPPVGEPSADVERGPGGEAELLLVDALIWTGDPERPSAQALAVADGRLIALGSDEEVRALQGPDTFVIDADGARVIPGLIDAHLHLFNAARGYLNLELRPAASREALLELVAAHAAQLPADAWVIGRGWSAESWPDTRAPTAAEIDAATGGRPAWLVRMDGHSGLASSAALALAGIDRFGPADPAGGRIERNAEGEPLGFVADAAMGLVTAQVPAHSVEAILGGMRQALDQLSAWGITRVGAIEPANVLYDLLPELDRAGALPVFVHGTIWEGLPLPRWRTELARAAAKRSSSPRVAIQGFKAYADGSLGSRTAWLHAPYDDDAGNRGLAMPRVLDGTLRDLIALAAAQGLQPAIHAIGDRANTEVLDLYADLDTRTRRSIRPRIEHAQHLRPQDIARFTELGVVASMQPLHKADDGRYAEDRLGSKRLLSSYAYRSLIDGGANLAFGSDWPVVSANPLLGLRAAVVPETLEGLPFGVSQAITVEEALTAYTSGSAFALHAEQQAGALAVGMSADFCLLSDDLLAVDPRALDELRVLLTVCAGEVVHDVR